MLLKKLQQNLTPGRSPSERLLGNWQLMGFQCTVVVL